MKWLAFAAVLIPAAVVVCLIEVAITGSDGPATVIAAVVRAHGGSGLDRDRDPALPALRDRRLINRTLVYAVLTAPLAARTPRCRWPRGSVGARLDAADRGRDARGGARVQAAARRIQRSSTGASTARATRGSKVERLPRATCAPDAPHPRRSGRVLADALGDPGLELLLLASRRARSTSTRAGRAVERRRRRPGADAGPARRRCSSPSSSTTGARRAARPARDRDRRGRARDRDRAAARRGAAPARRGRGLARADRHRRRTRSDGGSSATSTTARSSASSRSASRCATSSASCPRAGAARASSTPRSTSCARRSRSCASSPAASARRGSTTAWPPRSRARRAAPLPDERRGDRRSASTTASRPRPTSSPARPWPTRSSTPRATRSSVRADGSNGSLVVSVARRRRRRRRRARARASPASPTGWPPTAAADASTARPARARPSPRSCRAGRDRRGPGAAARGARRGCSRTPATRCRPPSATPTGCAPQSPSTSPTSPSSTSACRRRSPTRASARRSGSATPTPTSGCSCSPSTSRPRGAVDLVAQGGFGYLLKDRVLDVDEFLDAAARVAGGGSALDPKVVAALVGRERRRPARRR